MDDREPIELDELRSGSVTPEAITEQPDLAFERHPESKWLGDVFGMRMIAVALTWKQGRGSGQAPAVPWVPLILTAIVADRRDRGDGAPRVVARLTGGPPQPAR